MDFSLTDSQKMLRTTVHDFAEKELEPIAAEIDEHSRFPCAEFEHMARLGLTGLAFPPEYGGGGAGKIEEIIVDEELARVSAAVSTILFASSGLAGWPTFTYSNEEQRQRFIVPLAEGSKIASFALTEPGAGSDAASLQTTARKVAGGYRLDGTKVFISNGAEASFVLVFATLDRKLKHKGITGFIVERGMPGFTVAKVEHKLGIRASSTAELVFEDCFVPDGNRLDGEGQGFKIAINAIDSSRVSVAAQGLGIARGAFEKALSYARDRQQFGQPIGDFQGIQWMLADMATQMDDGATAHIQGGVPPGTRSAIRKGSLHGQAVRRRSSHVCYDEGTSDSRRLRLHQELPPGKVFQGRPHPGDLRGDFGDAEAHHREATAEGHRLGQSLILPPWRLAGSGVVLIWLCTFEHHLVLHRFYCSP